MIVTDSAKIFIKNSNLIGKILFYKIICIVILCGIAVASCYPLVMTLYDAGVFTRISDLFVGNAFSFDLTTAMQLLANLVTTLVWIIANNFVQFLPLLLVCFANFGILGSFMFHYIDMAVTEYVYGYMASNSRLSLGGCIIKNLGKSFRYSLAHMIVTLPVDLMILASFVGSCYLYDLGTIFAVMAPFLTILIVSILSALRITIFGSWLPEIVVRESRVWQGFRESLVCVFRNFSMLFSRTIVIVLTIIALIMAAWLFTASVGLFLVIPAAALFVQVYGEMVFFYTNGLRFYLDKDTIITPKKKEDIESIRVLKYIV